MTSIGSCPTLSHRSDVVKLGHGSGGRMTAQLIESVFLPYLSNPILNQLEDAADIDIGPTKLVVSTDSYVVKPLTFPGGDIGSLCVHGTINDLSMRLAKPLFLTISFILEEGFPLSELEKIMHSCNIACAEASVQVIAADTKVVNKGAGDGIYITTTGIGVPLVDRPPSACRAHEGDVVIVNGDIGRHGISILCRREGIDLETDLESDSASLHRLAAELAELNADIHCMRDLTRGGLSSALNELAVASSVGIEIIEHEVPYCASVRAACEILGLDPLYVACEGRFVAVVAESHAPDVLAVMHANE
ncbi:MAG: hydrogenase expression/formation protein HypE, partial [Cyanobacteria bacterium]|nr:hydrogenase expression/formation protein HypE [Cyanobacteriota bacterium]